MSKECIQAKPEDIVELLYEVYDVPSGICEHIKNMVQRLESTDNANPSEALECLKQIEDVIETKIGLGVVNTYLINIIKQALIKAQEQEKVLEIIFEKNVNVYYFKDELAFWNLSYEYYINNFSSFHNGPAIKMLDEEEFELLKQYFEKIFKNSN